MSISRRDILGTLAAAGTVVLSAAEAAAQAGAPPAAGSAPAPPARRAPAPLPFDPKKLRGLSERMIRSHHANNYAGALGNLHKVQVELGRVTKDTPGFLVSGLCERELTFSNSVVLHELYFGNLGGSGRPEGAAARALAQAFGSLARWEELFRATAASLAGGSGWAVLGYDFHGGGLRNYAAGSHSQALAFGAPLLVLDMYEHAYHIDYGAAAARYIDAFFANVSWGEVSARLERAERAAALLRA